MKSFQQPDFEVIKFEYEDIMRPSIPELPNEGGIFNEDDDYTDSNSRGNF